MKDGVLNKDKVKELSSFSKKTFKEGLSEYKNWFKGSYFFLLERSMNKYSLKKTSIRRSLVSEKIHHHLPPLTDEHLLFLTQTAISKCKI